MQTTASSNLMGAFGAMGVPFSLMQFGARSIAVVNADQGKIEAPVRLGHIPGTEDDCYDELVSNHPLFFDSKYNDYRQRYRSGGSAPAEFFHDVTETMLCLCADGSERVVLPAAVMTGLDAITSALVMFLAIREHFSKKPDSSLKEFILATESAEVFIAYKGVLKAAFPPVADEEEAFNVIVAAGSEYVEKLQSELEKLERFDEVAFGETTSADDKVAARKGLGRMLNEANREEGDEDAIEGDDFGEEGIKADSVADRLAVSERILEISEKIERLQDMLERMPRRISADTRWSFAHLIAREIGDEKLIPYMTVVQQKALNELVVSEALDSDRRIPPSSSAAVRKEELKIMETRLASFVAKCKDDMSKVEGMEKDIFNAKRLAYEIVKTKIVVARTGVKIGDVKISRVVLGRFIERILSRSSEYWRERDITREDQAFRIANEVEEKVTQIPGNKIEFTGAGIVTARG